MTHIYNQPRPSSKIKHTQPQIQTTKPDPPGINHFHENGGTNSAPLNINNTKMAGLGPSRENSRRSQLTSSSNNLQGDNMHGCGPELDKPKKPSTLQTMAMDSIAASVPVQIFMSVSQQYGSMATSYLQNQSQINEKVAH